MYKFLTNEPYDRSCRTHPYVFWDGGFTDIEMDNIQNYCESDSLFDSRIIGSSEKDEVEKVRISKVRFFERNDDTSWIFERFNDILFKVNDKFYNFNLNGYPSFQYTLYDSDRKGKYDWHMDTSLGKSIDFYNEYDRETRKLTCVLLLSEPGVDFVGGEFQIYQGGDIENPLTVDTKKGRMIIFPSFLIHRVKPVLLGVRKSIVIWISGPKFI